MSSVGVFTVGVTCDIGVGPAHGGRERNEDNYLVCYQNLVSYSADGAESRSEVPSKIRTFSTSTPLGAAPPAVAADEIPPARIVRMPIRPCAVRFKAAGLW